MTNPIPNALINQASFKYGMLVAAVSVIMAALLRFIDPLLEYSSLLAGLAVVIVTVALLVVFGLDVRKKAGGYWSFGQAFKSLIIMVAVTAIISTAYGFIIFKYVDPDMPQKVSALMQDKITTRLTNGGYDQDKIDENTKMFKNGEFEAKLYPTLKNELIAIASKFALYGISALIIAACIKKNALLMASTVNEDTVA
jgi:hypothetical protein